ncbi:MAG: T9SS type A sorting domain-containing protein [Bacteroidetes bacterium]|nr:T9SS type A sorting domain-containing protein [Bacteroidota bacterium]
MKDSSVIIAQFYNSNKNNPVGIFNEVSDLINQMVGSNNPDEYFTQAQLLNESVVSNFIFEENTKQVNSILNNHRGRINFENLDLSEKAILENIAWQCAFKGGKAVFQARAIVWSYNASTIFNDDVLCNDGQYFRQISNEEFIEELALSLSPNPSSESITIFYNSPNLVNPQFEFFDCFGKKVMSGSLELNTFRKQVDISYLNNGVYTIIIYEGNRHIKSLKLTKIK